MKLAILHYHLERGGVAQVIFDQLTGLAGSAVDQVVVLHGGGDRLPHEPLVTGASGLGAQLIEVEGLGYDDRPEAEPELLAQRLRDSLATRGMGPEDTLIHVHNHSLGKNTSLPGALWRLAEDGYRMVLQLHDFVEDQRPAGYERLRHAMGSRGGPGLGSLYPQAAHVHYGVLNHRDHAILRGAGVDPDRLHLLPNGVPDRAVPGDRGEFRRTLSDRGLVPAGREFMLAPARGIRRKNLGETLLWSALFDGSIHVGLTLPPSNAVERPGYDRWVSLAQRLDLPCTFGLGAEHGVPIAHSFAAADHVVTTSVAEGFGLAFLEAPLAHRPLVGRDLPEVTKDFVDHGVTFPGLRERLDVPVRWFGAPRLTRVIEARYQATLASYGRTADSGAAATLGVDLLIEAKLYRGLVDFADLDWPLQQMVLTTVAGDPRRQRELRDLNGWMTEALEDSRRIGSDDANAEAIRAHYSVTAATRRLQEVYERVWDESTSDPVTRLADPDAILDGFLRVDRFRAVLA